MHLAQAERPSRKDELFSFPIDPVYESGSGICHFQGKIPSYQGPDLACLVQVKYHYSVAPLNVKYLDICGPLRHV